MLLLLLGDRKLKFNFNVNFLYLGGEMLMQENFFIGIYEDIYNGT